jgi:ATP phosphoribosyltransferase
MFRVAIPNKGSLSLAATEMLKEAGYKMRSSDRQLVLQDLENGIEFFYLRPRDIAVYVGSGTLDVGITGLDLMLDAQSDAITTQDLGFAKSSFRFAAPQGTHYKTLDDLSGARIATSYANLVGNYLREHGVAPKQIVRLDGAVESSIKLGVADVIADVVSTGTTLRQEGLEILGPTILESEAILIRSPKTSPDSDELQILTQRLEGVLTAREYVMMDFDIETRLIPDAKVIAPGFEAPTISSLSTSDGKESWSAVRVMIRRRSVNQVMDQLHKLGARAIIVTQILASRL